MGLGLVTGLFDWTNNTLLPLGPYGLFLLAVIESIFFPVPTDVLLIILAAASPVSWWWLAIVAAIGSVLGAMIGYWIGYAGEMVVLERLFPKKWIEKAHKLFDKYEYWAIFIAGFTPIPYKVFAVSAGVFYIRFWPFILTSLVARSLRFLLVAGTVAWFVSLGLEFSMELINAFTIFIVLLALEVWLTKKIWFSGSPRQKDL